MRKEHDLEAGTGKSGGRLRERNPEEDWLSRKEGVRAWSALRG